MKIELIQHTPEPEKVVAAAAKLCYSASGADEIMSNLSDKKIKQFLLMLMDLGHESPIEHVSFTFAAEGVSRVLTHQLVRHRIASYSQQSQRYVKLEQFEYIIPPSIQNITEAREKFIVAMQQDQKYYNELTDILCEHHIKNLIAQGETEEKARRIAEKMAIEDARYVFPNACETKIIFTMNARSLMNFFRNRCCQRAQWEIREMATKMLNQVKHVAPNLFQYAGPDCLRGTCPEGKMSCGKMIEIKEKFLGSSEI